MSEKNRNSPEKYGTTSSPGHVRKTWHRPQPDDLFPVDSCLDLLSALDSRNGVMSMHTSWEDKIRSYKGS